MGSTPLPSSGPSRWGWLAGLHPLSASGQVLSGAPVIAWVRRCFSGTRVVTVCLKRLEVFQGVQAVPKYFSGQTPTKISLTLSSGAHLRGDMLLTTERLNWTELMLLTYSCKKLLLRCQVPSLLFFPPAPCVLPKGNWKLHDVLLPALISESRSLHTGTWGLRRSFTFLAGICEQHVSSQRDPRA